jgi:UDP-N-acetylmuramoyl-tripeptide--D-alanyl-D-alanine ligase
VVVPADWAGEIPPGRAALRVADPLAALVALAADARAGWDAPVIAITGSVGKTTAKEMAATVLEAGGPVLRSPGNFNTPVGLARTILAADPPRLAVLEIGASLPGEIARLAALAKPTAAAVTNVAAAHLEGFGTLDDVAREKTDLLRAVPDDGLRVVDGDDRRLVAAATADGRPVLRTGLGEGNDLRAVDVEPLAGGGTHFVVDGVPVELPSPGVHQVRNALLALALGRAHGVDLPIGAARLREFSGVAGRLVVRRAGDVTVADDSYNANPASVAAALDWFAGFPAAGRKAVALGDMLELGPESDRWHREVGARVAELAPDFVIFTGRESRAAFEEYRRRRSGDRNAVRRTDDSDEAARILRAWVRPGDAVLVKGSRGIAMERVVAALTGGENADAV